MSSFMVSNESLRKIATVLRDCVTRSRLVDRVNTYPIVTDELKELLDVDEQTDLTLYCDIYSRLHGMNVSALYARYDDDADDMYETLDEVPKPIEGEFGGVLWEEEYPLENKPAFVKTCQCYLYQCSESDEIENSTLFKAVSALEKEVALTYIESTPQYENADWA